MNEHDQDDRKAILDEMTKEADEYDLYEATSGPMPEPRKVKWMLCPQCEGEGMMVHRAMSVWTAEDRYEDPDGFEDMMNGFYDVECDMCHGLRVVDKEMMKQFEEEREDHYTMLMEQGIYPGSKDWF